MKRAALLTLLFAVLTAVMAYPWSMHPGSQVLADLPDIHLFIWTLAWDTHAFVHQPFSIFDANIFYPFHNSLAFSENLIGTAFTAAPIIWITGDPLLAMNLAAQLTCVLCGVGAYKLARTLGAGAPAAVLAGIVFAFAPPRFMRMGQIHMTAAVVPAWPTCTSIRSRRARPRIAIAFFTLRRWPAGAAPSSSSCRSWRGSAPFCDPRTPGRANWVRDVGIPRRAAGGAGGADHAAVSTAQQGRTVGRSRDSNSDSCLASPSHFHHWVLSFFDQGFHSQR